MAPLIALLLSASIDLNVAGCDATLDAAALKRLVLLEWSDPPNGTAALVTCAEQQWSLHLEAPGLLPTDEQLELPALSGPARTRVLALIIAERGRVFTHAPPAAPPLPEAPPPPLVAMTRTPAQPSSEPSVSAAEPARASPLRDGLVVFGSRPDGQLRPWRLAVAAAAVRPTVLQPWRFGPEVRVHGGPFSLTLTSTVGTHAAELGTLTALAVTAEPEVALACAGGGIWRLCAAARGILGYGSVSATTTLEDIGTRRQEGPLLGGAGVLSGTLAILDWLALDADARLGWAWGVYGSQAGVPAATVGGGFFAASLALVATWGTP